MTTRRNNMFYYRGACSAYATLRGIIKEIKTDEERLAKLEEFRQMWLNGANDFAHNQTPIEIDSETIITKYYFVRLFYGKLVLFEPELAAGEIEVILWDKETRTNHIVEICTLPKTLSRLYPDIKDIKEPLAKLIGCDPKELKIVERPYKIYVLPNHDEEV